MIAFLLWLAGAPREHHEKIGPFERALLVASALLNSFVAALAMGFGFIMLVRYGVESRAALVLALLWGAFIFVLDRAMVMALNVPATTAKMFAAVIARFALCLLLSYQVSDSAIKTFYADRIAEVRAQNMRNALESAKADNAKLSGITDLNGARNGMLEEQATLRVDLASKTIDVAGLLQTAQSAEQAVANKQAAVVGTTQSLASQMSLAEQAARQARENARINRFYGYSDEVQRARAAAADRRQSAAAQTLSAQDLALAELRQTAKQARADYDAALSALQGPINARLGELEQDLTSSQSALEEATRTFDELSKASKQTIEVAFGPNPIAEEEALAKLVTTHPSVAFNKLMAQAVLIVLELLPLIFKLICGRGVLYALLAKERAEATSNLRAEVAEIDAKALIAEIEQAALVRAAQAVALDPSETTFKARAEAHYQSQLRKVRMRAELDQLRTQNEGKQRKATGFADALLAWVRRAREQLKESRTQNDPIFGQDLEAEIRKAQVEDFNALRRQYQTQGG